MSANTDARSIFQKAAILFTFGLVVTMVVGGVTYYFYADSLLSNIASLTIGGVGSYVLYHGIFVAGIKVALEFLRDSWELAVTIGKYILRHLLLKA
jgi:hypothetical protein